jgi:hypothetical protein
MPCPKNAGRTSDKSTYAFGIERLTPKEYAKASRSAALGVRVRSLPAPPITSSIISTVANLLDVERFRWDAPQALTPGKHTIVFEFTYDGPGPGKGGTGVLGIDGIEVVNKTVPHTIPFLMTLDETFDIGSDTRTPVDDSDYQVPFPFTGSISKLTYQLGPEQLTEADRAVIGSALAKARD